MDKQYEIKNKELFNELDDLIYKIYEKYDQNVYLPKKLYCYTDDYNAYESGKLPDLIFERYDNEDTLHELIELAKNELEK